jgi:hypothetical protein
VTALAICMLFGLVRGLVVLLTAPAHAPTDLRTLHRRFADWGSPVRLAVIGVELAVVVTALAAQWHLAGAAVAVAAAVVLALLGSSGVRSAIGDRRRLPIGPP